MSETPPRVVVIAGPTATGKTKLGVLLSQSLDGEVVSADSMQIYQGMDIGTAKPTRMEMDGVPHHMMDIARPEESYSVSRYVREASECVDDILSRGKLPVIVGGTGLYIDSLLSGRRFAALPEDPGVREDLAAQYELYGGGEMLRRLAGIDPQRAAKLHPNDKKRILRALEIYQVTGKTITHHDAQSRLLPPRYSACFFALNFKDRGCLYERINNRVDEMMRAGLMDEVKGLLARGLGPGSTAMQAIGYKELAAALEAGSPVEAAVEEIKLESRRYAKRQLTWLRRRRDIKWILWENEPDFDFARRYSTEFFTCSGIE